MTLRIEVIYFVQLLTLSEKIKIAGGSLKSCFTPMQLECADLNCIIKTRMLRNIELLIK